MNRLRQRSIWYHSERPSLGEQAAIAGRAGLRAAKAIATGSQVAALPETVVQRKAICHSCDKWIKGGCELCGCFTALKIKLATEACPLGKWGVVSETAKPPNDTLPG